MNITDLAIELVIFVGTLLLVHYFVKQYWKASILGASSCAIINLIYEWFYHDAFSRHPETLYFVAVTFLQSLMILLPVSLAVGMLFYYVRNHKGESG